MTATQPTPPIVHLDSPAGGLIIAPAAQIQGWIAVDSQGGFDALSLVGAEGRVIPLAPITRPDVQAVFPGRATIGFSGCIGSGAAAELPWRIRFELDGTPFDLEMPLAADNGSIEAFASIKARKLERIRPLLRCPICGATVDAELRCASDHAFRQTEQNFDFLDDETRRRVGAVPTSNVSAHGYDPTLVDLISQCDGPIADIGAGLRPEYREDVINVEIVPYATTDVVAASEYLPFADDTFDLVISVAVLEHVRDPFAAAREIERILRPGGRVFAAVPFLQPYHAYPDHYYNMTAAGLRNLFLGCDVERLDVPDSGHPAFVLSWILRAWRDALPAGTASSFEQMHVSDLIADPVALMSQPFASELPYSAREQLAAINLLIGRKR
ncbi:MAG: class I SAM-dependent methyltransferase [Vulcanimicrobiaceae bacterium]|jgi:SAM-dependent methyltransferase